MAQERRETNRAGPLNIPLPAGLRSVYLFAVLVVVALIALAVGRSVFDSSPETSLGPGDGTSSNNSVLGPEELDSLDTSGFTRAELKVTTTTAPQPTLLPPPDPDAAAALLLEVDFQNQEVGEYTESEMDTDFDRVGDWANGFGEGRTNIVEEGGNKYLRLLFEEGTRGHVQWKADLGGAHEDVYLEYNVRFEDNGNGFDFRDAGKLPGLAGGTAPTGGDDSADGLGYSARFTWRNVQNNPDAYLVQYMYDMDKDNGNTGRHVTLGGSAIYAKTNHWYTVNSHIVMNTPGKADGVIQAWLDGELVLDIRDARLRSSSDLGTDILYFSTFFGGGDSEKYQTSKDEYIDYDNFQVWTGV